MKDLKKKFGTFFKKNWPLFGIFFLALTFFYPVWLENKAPLPADALVGAHVPWIELKWEEYPAGVPIKNQEITDSFSQFYPWRSLVGESWRAGKVALWNPYMFSGTPFLATLHSSALYPLNVLYVFLSDLNAWTGLVFLQIFLAAIFMYLFLIDLKIKKEASFLGAIVFSFSGYMVAWLEFATGGHAGLWLPLLLLFEHRLIKSEKSIWLLPISVVFFFIFTAGDFQVPLYICTAYILFGSFLLFQKKIARSLSLKSLLYVFAGLAFGILLSLPQLLPTLELFLQSIRTNDPYISEYYFGLMHWEKITNFIWPDFFGNVVTRNYWARFGYHEYLSFVGIIALVFCIYGLIVKKRKIEKFFWSLLVICLLFLFPTPIAFLPFKLKIPGLGTSSASRIIFLVDFCLAVLAAYGFSKWINGKKPTILRVVFYFLVVTVGVGLGVAVSLLFIKSVPQTFVPEIAVNLKVALRNMIPSTLVLLLLGLLFFGQYKILPRLKKKVLIKYFRLAIPLAVLLLASAEILRFAWKNTPFSPRKFVFPKTQIIEFLEKETETFRIAGGIPLNLFMPYKIRSAEGYDPIYPLTNGEWFSAVNSGNLESLSRRYGLIHNFSSPLIDYASVKYVVDYKKNIYGGISSKGNLAPGIELPRYKPVFSEGRISVFENTQTLPRVWLSTNYKIIPEQQQIIDELKDINANKERLIVVESKPEIPVERTDLDFTIENFTQTYNRIDLDVTTSENALLFLSESFYPGWKAYINDQEAEILRANYLFQAIAVPKGEHNIMFIYYPESFKIGKWATIATSVFLIGIIGYEQAKTKRKRSTQKRSS
ncbi:YfhO family protein [Candidatus Woesebacteria bacterium]|nr:YfhO family protein [Candidatus Woesebacteria bacterium]